MKRGKHFTNDKQAYVEQALCGQLSDIIGAITDNATEAIVRITGR